MNILGSINVGNLNIEFWLDFGESAMQLDIELPDDLGEQLQQGNVTQFVQDAVKKGCWNKKIVAAKKAICLSPRRLLACWRALILMKAIIKNT
jgi:hypothetical protein